MSNKTSRQKNKGGVSRGVLGNIGKVKKKVQVQRSSTKRTNPIRGGSFLPRKFKACGKRGVVSGIEKFWAFGEKSSTGVGGGGGVGPKGS